MDNGLGSRQDLEPSSRFFLYYTFLDYANAYLQASRRVPPPPPRRWHGMLSGFTTTTLTASTTTTRDSEGRLGCQWLVRHSPLFCLDYTNVLLINRPHTYATTTTVVSSRNEDDDDVGRDSRSRAPCIDRQTSRQFDAYMPPVTRFSFFLCSCTVCYYY